MHNFRGDYMKLVYRGYLLSIYFLFIFLIVVTWGNFSYPQLILSFAFIILTKMLNSNLLKDLQTNVSYSIIYPFIVPALVYLEPFYGMIYISIFHLLNYHNIVFYKRFFNASLQGIAFFVSSYIVNVYLNKNFIFKPEFFLILILTTYVFSVINKLNVTLVISLEKRKFDINSFIGNISAFQTSFFTIFLGLINVVLFYYTNIIGVAIFTFVIYFLKPALTYRHIFDNELSTYTNFVLHILKQMDPITHAHSERVKFWTVMLAKKMKLPSSEIRQLSQAASWHDIGKIEVSFDILNKAGKLTDEEYSIIKHHPEAGYQLVKDVHFFKKFLPVIRHHHEKVDGTGYPHGLVGDKIPLHARIMAITDAFDAMTFDRSYRKAMSMAEAVEELKKYAGKQFDANIVTVFIEALQDEYGEEFEDFDQKVIMNVS